MFSARALSSPVEHLSRDAQATLCGQPTKGMAVWRPSDIPAGERVVRRTCETCRTAARTS